MLGHGCHSALQLLPQGRAATCSCQITPASGWCWVQEELSSHNEELKAKLAQFEASVNELSTKYHELSTTVTQEKLVVDQKHEQYIQHTAKVGGSLVWVNVALRVLLRQLASLNAGMQSHAPKVWQSV